AIAWFDFDLLSETSRHSFNHFNFVFLEVYTCTLKKKRAADSARKDLPVFELQAFSKKANWSDFYIQDLKTHVLEHEFIGRPHKHDFYLILFVVRGTGTHAIDFVKYPIRPKTIFLMTPGQIHNW